MAAMTHVKQGGLIVVRPGEGKSVNFGGLGAQFKCGATRPVDGLQSSKIRSLRTGLFRHTFIRWRTNSPTCLREKLGCGSVTRSLRQSGAHMSTSLAMSRTPSGTPDQNRRVSSRSSVRQASRITLGRSQSFSKEAESRVALSNETIARRYHESFFLDWVPELKQRYGLKMLGED